MPAGVNAGRAWNTRYAVSGSGPVLVLIHGVGLDMTMWQRALPLLEPRFTVIRYDLVGHGKTPAIGERVALADFPAVQRWFAGMGARPAVQKGMAKP